MSVRVGGPLNIPRAPETYVLYTTIMRECVNRRSFNRGESVQEQGEASTTRDRCKGPWLLCLASARPASRGSRAA